MSLCLIIDFRGRINGKTQLAPLTPPHPPPSPLLINLGKSSSVCELVQLFVSQPQHKAAARRRKH